jgi:uncharacterized protein
MSTRLAERARPALTLFLLLATLAAVFAPVGAFAQDAVVDSTAPPSLGTARDYVVDETATLTLPGKIAIARYCGKVERALGVQFAVAVVPSTGSESIEEFAVRQFKEWGIGGAKPDEGLLLVVAVNDRKMRFEVGYGLEGPLPDGRLGTIIRSTLTPAFRAGQFDEGILRALTEAARFVAEDKGLPPPIPDGLAAPRSSRGTRELPFWAILVMVVVIWLLLSAMGGGGSGGRRRRGGGWILPGMYGGWGGGWSSGGGGGGGFGGGSGSGFGGFGGGSSGGGGASGSW